MTSSEKIRLLYTYLREHADLVDIKENMIQMDACGIWGDVKCGSFSTEKTAAMRKHIKELQAELPAMLGYLEQIDAEIRQMHAEEQIRMDTRRK